MTTETPLTDFCNGNMAKVIRYRYWKEGDDESIVRVAEVKNVVVFPLSAGGWIIVTEPRTDHPQGLFMRDDRILEIEFSEEATQVAMTTGIMSFAQMMEAVKMMKMSERGRQE